MKYSNYNINELNDMLNSIDQNSDPSAKLTIQNEISRRHANGELKKDYYSKESKLVQLKKKAEDIKRRKFNAIIVSISLFLMGFGVALNPSKWLILTLLGMVIVTISSWNDYLESKLLKDILPFLIDKEAKEK